MVTVVFKKHFIKGNLKGIQITDWLTFPSHREEQRWFDGCVKNILGKKLPWKFAELNGRYAVVVCEGKFTEQFVKDFDVWFECESASRI